MGKVIATCGHELTPKEGLGETVYTRAWTRENKHASDYQTLCEKCLEFYKKSGAILTKEEAREWINNK